MEKICASLFAVILLGACDTVPNSESASEKQAIAESSSEKPAITEMPSDKPSIAISPTTPNPGAKATLEIEGSPTYTWGMQARIEKRLRTRWKPVYFILRNWGDARKEEEASCVQFGRNVTIFDIGFLGSASDDFIVPRLPTGRYRISKRFLGREDEVVVARTYFEIS